MGIKVTINGKEVKNPIVRFLITLVGLVIFLVIFVFVFFLIFPIIWFWTLSVMLLVFTLLAFAPKLISQYKIIVINKKKLEKDRKNSD